MTKFKQFHRVILSLLLLMVWPARPTLASETIVLRYGLLEESIPVSELRTYAETREATGGLRDILGFLDQTEQLELQMFLNTTFPLERVALDRVLNRAPGTNLLAQVAPAIARPDQAGIQALRAAAVLGSQPGQGLNVLNFLAAYPAKRLVINVPEAFQILGETSPKPPQDILATTPFWQTMVDYQVTVSQGKTYQVCLFGDSIAAELGNSLGEQTVNFSLGGMSTVSLLEQLKQLRSSRIKCQAAIVEIGTNDAWYSISQEQFQQNLEQIIDGLRSQHVKHIILLPAFYSTLAASQNPALAGPIERVDQINQVLNQVARAKQVPVATAAVEPLFEGKTLKQSLTVDGIHLNAEGIQLFRAALQKVIAELT